MTIIDRDVKERLTEYAMNFAEDEVSSFVRNVGWEDWMDDYCEDPKNPNEVEMEEIQSGLEELFRKAHEKLIRIPNGTVLDWDTAVNLMDDDIREDIHNAHAPCSNSLFFDLYAAAHLAKFGEEWELTKENPQF